MRSSVTVGMVLCVLGLGLIASSLWISAPSLEAPPAADGSEFVAQNGDAWVPPVTGIVEQQQTASASPEQISPLVRLRVPRIGVDAPVEVLGVTGRGAMEDPSTPSAVAWYDFSAQPGRPGNVVMAGHVDYHNYGPAVFWRLRELKTGDQIELTLQDGTVYVYEVAFLTSYNAATAPVSEIVGPVPQEALTLITCGGRFDRGTREYNQRLVVRATRVAPASPGG